MAITRPVSKSTVATATWGFPMTDEVNRLTTQSNADHAAIPPLQSSVATLQTSLASFLTPTWKAWVPSSGWQDQGAPNNPLTYAVFGTWILARGLVKNITGATVNASADVAVLPSDAWPLQAQQVFGYNSSSALTVRVNVTVTGVIRVFFTASNAILNGGWVSVDNIFYNKT